MLNARKLKDLTPRTIASEIQNYSIIAKMALAETESEISVVHIDFMGTPVSYANSYEKLNPQNKVLAHGIFFKKLFEKYKSFLIINFNDPWTQTGTRYANRPMITKAEFQKMPKRYRSIFAQYDATHYVLREHKDTILTVASANKEQLKGLLYNARMTIPLIYNIKSRENAPVLSEKEHEQKWLNRTLESTFMKPAFVSDADAKRVNNQQINTIYKLRNIFREIDGISLMWTQERDNTHCAADIYAQYLNELSQKNRYLNMSKETSGLKALYDNAPENERDGIAVLIKRAKEQNAIKRQQMITNAQIRVK